MNEKPLSGSFILHQGELHNYGIITIDKHFILPIWAK